MGSSNTDKLVQPLSYIDWLQQSNIDTAMEVDLFSQYNQYVRTFYADKGISASENRQTIVNVYKDLLKDIVINYSTVDERRFLSNIDYDDPAELDIIIPYFAKKLKHITQYLAGKRQDVQFSKTKHNFKGSESGIKRAVKTRLYDLLGDDDFRQQYPDSSLPTITEVIDSVNVDTVVLYDTYQNYFDVDNTLPKSAYSQGIESGYHHDYFNSNSRSINHTAFINLESAIQLLLDELPQILTTACSDDIASDENIQILLNIPRTDISELPHNYFVNATKTLDDLILQYDKYGSEKYAGTSMHYLSTGSSTTVYVSGVLFEAKNTAANYLNRYFPSVASSPNTNNLSTLSDLGGFFTPTKHGILNYSAPTFTYKLDTSNMAPNTLYVFPDPDIYATGRGNTKTDQSSPYTHTDDISPIKSSLGNGNNSGDVVNTSKVQKMWPYQSTEETLQLHPTGMSRSSDNTDFWIGTRKDIWGNSDIYPLIVQQDLPVQDKLDDLLISSDTLYQWKTDIFGHEYGLYKPLHPQRVTTAQQDGNYISTATQSINTALHASLSSLFNKQNSIYQDYQTTSHTTRYDSELSDISEEVSVYDRHDIYGNWYVRNSLSTLTAPASSALSGVFVKYTQTPDIINEINYKVRNFDIIKDILIIETQNFLIFEKIKYDPATELLTSSIGQRFYISLSGANRSFENFSNLWYNDVEHKIYVSTLLAYPYLSGSNYKAIYPRIYEYDIKKDTLRDVYSLSTALTSSDTQTVFTSLCTQGFSLSGTSEQINIVTATRPNICHDRLNKKFTVSYIGLDPANKPYTTVMYFNTKTLKTFDVDKCLLIKPVGTVSNYNANNFNEIKDTLEGSLDRGNISVESRFSTDGLLSEIDFAGTFKNTIYGPSSYPSLSGRAGTAVTRYVDTNTNTFLFGQEQQLKIANAGENATIVDTSDILPHTHNSSYIIDNTGLDPTKQDIEIYADVALYTLTTGNSANTSTLNTTHSAFEATPTEYDTTRAPGGGLCIFLFDTQYEFYPAGIGSALGYTNYTGAMGTNYAFTSDINGIRGGYVGVGFDVEGNFSNTTDGKTGTTGLTAFSPGTAGAPYTGTVGTCPDATVAPNTLTLRSSELSSYRVLSTTNNLSTYPNTSVEEYTSTPALTLHEYVDSRDDITFHKLKVSLQNEGTYISVEVLNSADGKFYPYLEYDLGAVAVPATLRAGISFATSDHFTNCEVKNFNVYGESAIYFKNRTSTYFEPLSTAAFSVSAHNNFCS